MTYVHNEDNIIETSVELDKLHGPDKFQRVKNAQDVPEPFVEQDISDFQRMKKEDLLTYVEDNEIDITSLGENPTKAKIVELLESLGNE